MTRATFGPPWRPPAGRRWNARVRARARLRASASPTSAKPRWSGTGPPASPFTTPLSWQDRRTAPLCRALKEAGHEPLITEATGLLLDPYFSATKLAWLLDNVDGARARAEAGALAFGTVDSWLIWNLTGGRAHVTDATNAARTMLYDIRRGGWSEEICGLLNVPMGMLPEVMDCAADFGATRADLFGAELPILGVAGDQQAATLGQACFQPGMLKSTYGTGCFALLNTGGAPVVSQNRLLTTIAYQLDGTPTYALEGSIFVAGRGGAMAARRVENHPRRAGDASPGGGGGPGAGGGAGARVHRAGRALLERRVSRRGLWALAQFRARGIRPGGA